MMFGARVGRLAPDDWILVFGARVGRLAPDEGSFKGILENDVEGTSLKTRAR